jgi:predicted Zn-dependent peptidase
MGTLSRVTAGEGRPFVLPSPTVTREKVAEGRMRVRFVVLFLIGLFSIQMGFANPPSLPEFPPLHFHPPKPVRYVLDNGLIVYLLEDHELPLIRLDMYVKAGTQYDPIDKIGLGGIFGEAMTNGGTVAHPPEEIEKTLDRKAASINFSVELENGGGSMSSRKEDFDAIFGLFTDLILHPQFQKDKFELAKAKALESLRRMNDDPDEVARREFRKIMYGNHHPYARIPSPEMIKNIKREDLLEAHKRFFRPNGCWIAISGDFQSAEMLAKVKTALGSWPKTDTTWAEIPEPPATIGQRVFYIQKPINQSQIRIGDLGMARHNPDHFAWEVFNELWGGGGTSRLFRTVRTEMGLAYSVGSGFSEPQERGLILAVSQTRGSQTIRAAQAILKINQEVREAPFTSAEISDAKESIRNRFVENFISSEQIAAYMMNLEYFGFPEDYLDTYTQKIGAVEAADLQRVGRAYLHPERSTILVMGDLSTFEKPLATLGHPQEIKLIDYSVEAQQ